MEKTVKSEFLVHSLHAYFLLAGDSRKKILYTVERIHDGRSFCRRRVTGKQDNRAIFVVTASFKTAESEPKLEYQIPSTEMLALLSYFDVPRGGTYINLVFFSKTIQHHIIVGTAMGNLPSAEELIARGETPVRDSITGHTISVTICERENFLLTWRKHERKLPLDSPWSDHAAIVAYITDNGTVATVRQPFLHNETLWKGKSPPPRM